jgi:hypothetical protein
VKRCAALKFRVEEGGLTLEAGGNKASKVFKNGFSKDGVGEYSTFEIDSDRKDDTLKIAITGSQLLCDQIIKLALVLLLVVAMKDAKPQGGV